MMTCRNVQHVLQQFIDGELPASLTAEVHAHLLQCPACQREVEVLRAGADVISKDSAEPTLQPGFASRVVAAMMEQSRSPVASASVEYHGARRLRWRKYALAGGLPAAAAMVFLAVMIWPSAAPQEPATLVAGVSVMDAAGVKDLTDETMAAVSDARQAAQSLNRLLHISADQAGQGVRAGLEQVGRQPKGEGAPTLVEILLQPFNHLLLSDEPATTTDSSDEIVRF